MKLGNHTDISCSQHSACFRAKTVEISGHILCGSIDLMMLLLTRNSLRYQPLEASAHEHRRGRGQAHERNRVRVVCTHHCHQEDGRQGRAQQESDCSRLNAQHEDGEGNGREKQTQSQCDHR